jgi:Kef-type K+ transport system membrane component KefB
MGASHQVSEPEIKFLLFILFFLGGLSTTAKSEAVLPAYLMGLVIAGVFMRDKTVVNRMRSIAFAIFTPFYFIKAGLYVSLPAAWSAIGIIAFLFFIKMGSKYIVFPFARVFSMRSKESHYTSLLMGTGLTFGTIASLYGLNNHIINQKQYTILVTVVILSAVLPTLFAQKYFKPKESTMNAWGRLRNKNDFIKSNELTEEKAGTH